MKTNLRKKLISIVVSFSIILSAVGIFNCRFVNDVLQN